MNGAGQKGFGPFEDAERNGVPSGLGQGPIAGSLGGVEGDGRNNDADAPTPGTAPTQEPLELSFLDGETARQLVAGIQAAARVEAAARGQLLRLTADLYEAALARRGETLPQRLTAAGPWAAAALAQGSVDVVAGDVAAEIAVALMLPAGTARATVAEALIFATDLPRTLAALEAGEITWAQARVILTHWRAIIEDAPTRHALARMSEPDRQAALAQARHLEEQATTLVAELLARAPQVTTTQLGDYARRRRAALGAAGHRRACAAARRRRDVWVTPEDDGLATLCALLDAPTATAIAARVHRMATTLTDTPTPQDHPAEGLPTDEHLTDEHLTDEHSGQEGKGTVGNPLVEHRSLGEKRADVLADLLLDAELPASSGVPRGIRGQVMITVPATSLIAHDPNLTRSLAQAQAQAQACGATGQAQAPTAEAQTLGGSTRAGTTAKDPGAPAPAPVAVLAGYGPISDTDALRIAASASSWRRVLTDPHTGVITDYSRTTYTVPAGLRALLTIRDETCRFPGCRRNATGCDVDHTIPWATGGTTSVANLAHLCRHHHRVKHEATTLGAWQVRHINPHTAEPLTTIPENTSARGVSGQQHPAGQRAPAGVLEWTSPTGTVRRTVPGTATPITTSWLTNHPDGHATTGPAAAEPAPRGQAGGQPQATTPDDPPPF